MSYNKKTWQDRVSESPNRRTLTVESQDSTNIVCTVQRTEGEVSKEGDAFNAENMNDLEDRIENGLNEKLDGQKLESDIDVILSKTSADGSAPDCYALKLLYDELKKLVADGKKLVADAISAQSITTVTSDMTFAQLAEAITSTGSGKYSNGYDAGYTQGKADGEASGSTEGYTTGYAAGKSDGISYADGRENTDSVSYKNGYTAGATAGVNAISKKITVSCNGSGTSVMNPDYGNYNTSNGTARATVTISGGSAKLEVSVKGGGTSYRYMDGSWSTPISSSYGNSNSESESLSA